VFSKRHEAVGFGKHRENDMQGTKYTKSIGNLAKRPGGLALQAREFNLDANAPAKGCKPKLWGYHKPANAKPGLCVISNGQGVTLRIVKSVSKPMRIK
jgi:hypothetical protein